MTGNFIQQLFAQRIGGNLFGQDTVEQLFFAGPGFTDGGPTP